MKKKTNTKSEKTLSAKDKNWVKFPKLKKVKINRDESFMLVSAVLAY